MATRVWHSGAVDNIYAPYEWTPYGLPQPGDTLVIGQGTAFLGGNLSGSKVVLSSYGTVTPQPTLVVYGNASATVLVDQELFFGPSGYNPSAYGTIDVVGNPTVHLTVTGERITGSAATVNIGAYSQMRGDVTDLGGGGSVTINGTRTSQFANGASKIENNAGAVIKVSVVGTGTFDLGIVSTLEFTAGVSAGQTINQTGGFLIIDDTKDFHATVNLSNAGSAEFISLPKLVADAYTFHNDLLSFTSGGKDVFDLKLDTPGVAVSFAGGIHIQTAPASAIAQVALPNHA